jgi:hypothetical protein
MKRPDSENNPPPGPKVVPLEVVGEIPRESEASRVPPPASGQASTPGKGGTARFVVTLAVAALADGAEVLFPMAWVPIDLATVGVFFLLWGVRWEVALVLIPELAPGCYWRSIWGISAFKF